ncbi:MAG: PrsW family intramembrane metalloprotease [Anaerolineales bacterium]|nr:PrsW family intramembrane metalloprotease [Anaerolineales bacterium]
MSSSTVLILSIIAAIIPTLIYILIIYWVDRYEKEPVWLLTSAFLWGAIPSIVVAFIVNSTLSIPVYLLAGDGAGDALAASLIAPPVEETVKGIAVLGIFFFWRHEIDSVLDGIIYGAMVGMGFAMVENVYYFVNQFMDGGIEAWSINIFMRAVVFGLNHALFTSMTGLGIAVARMTTNKTLKYTAPVLGWMTAVFLHFVHNASVSIGDLLCLVALASDWGGVLLIFGIMVWAVVQERKWIREYLAEEVTAGTITAVQYKTACSGRKRVGYIWKQLTTNGFSAYRQSTRFFQRCSELAYKKRHYSLFQNEKNLELAAALRDEITELRSSWSEPKSEPTKSEAKIDADQHES